MKSLFKNFSCVILLVLLYSGSAFSLDAISCPQPNPKENIFKSPVAGGAVIAIETTNDEHNPLSLAIYDKKKNNDCIRDVFTKYSMEGGAPKIESLFYFKINGKINIITIVSWEQNHRAIGTYGKLYQVYAYALGGDNKIHENKEISNDDALSGIEGYSNGSPSTFKYKTASDVKSYLENKYR